MLDSTSNAGGVAARRGFKYQDHIAARFVIEMIDDPKILSIECETSDDVTINRQIDNGTIVEHVQVKTTDAENKWSITDITRRTNGRVGTSLVEKSLLCDTREGECRFRVVSSRDLSDKLSALAISPAERSEHLASSLKKPTGAISKLKCKSPNNRDTSYWIDNVTWDVTGAMDAVNAKNIVQALRLASERGNSPVHSHIQEIYRDLLNLVATAAEACRNTEREKKKISRDSAIEWWNSHLQEVEDQAEKNFKPYKSDNNRFFIEVHTIDEPSVLRYLNGFDAGFELSIWRTEPLAEYLSDWLPEIFLKASELTGIRPYELKRKVRLAIARTIEAQDPGIPSLLGETLLHAIVRHHFHSEPIACKIFYQSGGKVNGFNNAHIVHGPTEDQLWLGRSKVIDAYDHDALAKSLSNDLKDIINADFLKRERQVIITLREPQHLLPTSLEKALQSNTSIDELIKSLCIPILLAYDSPAINNGPTEDYIADLIAEIEANYLSIKKLIPDTLDKITIRIFLIPTISTKKLSDEFQKRIS